jgi:hypothetical protein
MLIEDTMRRIIMLSALVTAISLAGGCYATTSGGYYSGTVTATTVAPDLVYVSPGVQVIADYDTPIFYSDNYYWRYDGGRWYRSTWYTGGWSYWAAPPYAVTRIERPYAYRHYRPAGYVSRRAPVRDHRHYNRPVYRDTRPAYRETRPVYRDSRPAPSPAVRDHRTYQPAPARTAPSPAVRDHRTHQPAPARTAPARTAPAVRDHRTAPSSSSRRSNVTVRDHR